MYIVTGSKRQHAQTRAVIVKNMPFFENELMRNVINRSVYRNLDHYLSVTRMIVMVLGVVTQKYKHLRHCSILQYILIVRHFVVGLDLGAMKCMA